MFGKLEFLVVNLLFFQATLPPDGTSILLDKGEKIGVVALLCVLVWTLHRQNERREEQIRLLYEARVTELKAQIDDLQDEVEKLKKRK